ncbi:class I SAM-dependent methyltransferase, partial [Candidatus Bathyarchaeota archaeon]|nr:class I SAM-dependent methyltransferase [Candidatus Bathyarchaeota archaeon]
YDKTFHNRYREKIQDKIIFRVLHALLPETSKILDAGGGTGFYSLPLAAKGHHMTVLDLSREMLDVAGAKSRRMGLADRVQTVLGDMEDTDLPFSEFDMTMCHLALCHVSDPLARAVVPSVHRPLACHRDAEGVRSLPRSDG